MSIESKNHRQPSVDVRVSEGTRAMARTAALKFADLDQEHAFWIQEKLSIQEEFEKAKRGLMDDIAEASRRLRGGEYMAKKIAAEQTWASHRRDLGKRLKEIEAALGSIKLRRKQHADRVKFQSDIKPDGMVVRGNPETALRTDGSVDLGVAMLLLLREMRGLRADLLANKKEEAAP